MRKSIPIQGDGSVIIPKEMVSEVFGKAREAVVHIRTGCLVLSPIYVDMESGTLPGTLARFHGPLGLGALFEKGFERGTRDAIQFEGDLAVLSLADVFLFLSASRKSGALVVKEDKEWGFFFQNGNLVYAVCDEPRMGFAAHLLKRQFLTEQDLVEALQPLEKTGDALRALFERSGLSPEEYREQWIRSVEETIFQVFTLSKGRFTFQNGTLKAPFVLSLPMTTTNYVMEATRRLDEWARIHDLVPPMDAVLEVAEDITASTRLTFEEEQVLGAATGTRDLQEILLKARVGEMEGKKAAASLLAAGLLRVQKPASKPEEEAPVAPAFPQGEREPLERRIATYNGVFTSIFQALSVEVGNKAEVILGAYFKGLEPNASLLSGLNLDEEGMVPVEPLLARLASVPDEREARLVAELNEVLYFQLFAVKNTLGAEMEAGIVEMAKTLLQEQPE